MNFLNSPGAGLVRMLGGGHIMDRMAHVMGQDQPGYAPSHSGGDPGIMPAPTQAPIDINAIMNNGASWTPDQEAQARAAGFPSADAAAAWQRQRAQRRAPQTVAGQSAPPQQAAPPPQQDPGHPMGWGPGVIFNWLADKLHGANQQAGH